MSFIRIRKDALSKPILETNEAQVIEFYSGGEMTALLTHQFSSDMWVLVTKLDPDWEATLIRLGYINIKTDPAQFVKKLKK